MYEVIGDYCFDLESDCYINSKGDKLDIQFDDNGWYAVFENGMVIEEKSEDRLIKKIKNIIPKEEK